MYELPTSITIEDRQYQITNNGDYGITDIYMEDTRAYDFSSLPQTYCDISSDYDTPHSRGRWFRGKEGQYITVHLKDGNTVIWTPDEIV